MFSIFTYFENVLILNNLNFFMYMPVIWKISLYLNRFQNLTY